MTLLGDIASGEVDTADVFFLIAVILFVAYALIGFVRTVDGRVPAVLLGLGLAFTSLALLIL